MGSIAFVAGVGGEFTLGGNQKVLFAAGRASMAEEDNSDAKDPLLSSW